MSDLSSGLSLRQQSVVPVAAYTAKGDQNALAVSLNQALDNGMTVNEIKEVLIQMYAYSGFPRSLNAINTFIKVLNTRRDRGIRDEDGPLPTPDTSGKTRTQLGADIQTQIAGRPLKAEKGNFIEFAPVINTFLQEHLFADIIGRNNLSLQDREIATIAALTGLGGVEGQLRSHINGGLNVGLSEQQIKALFTAYRHRVNAAEAEAGMKLLDDVMLERPR